MSSDDRLTQIEARLSAIERYIRMTAPQPAVPATPVLAPARAREVRPAATVVSPRALASRAPDSSSVTNILGWAGATALVLASVYLVVLAVDAGWLTPVRQVLLSMLGGVLCIGAGLMLRDKDMHYASLLPAAGIVILFLSMYGAHNYYHLIDTTFAASGIIAICLVSLWLNRLFLSELYALFAVVGSYTAPVLLGGTGYSIADLIVYFACWSVLFSLFSIWVGKRNVYMLAMYLALVIFDLKWHDAMPDAWVEALVFQTIHFLIFVAAGAVFSIRIEPMSQADAVKHVPVLVLFYFVQYFILAQHLPGLAPWIALASAAVLLLSYFVVQRVLGKTLEGGRTLLSSYVALVLVHAGYIESVPAQWAPWVGLAAVPLLALYASMRGDIGSPGLPLWGVAVLVFLANFLRLFAANAFSFAGSGVPAHELLGLCYAAELYAAYHLLRKAGTMADVGLFTLYAGHVAVMAWALQMFDSRFVVSLIWGALALGCLFLALHKRRKLLGQSSLLIFGASVLKAFLYDIAMAAPLIRIGSLLVLGASLYLGGWLYKKVNSLEDDGVQA